MKNVKIKKSKIHCNGVFASRNFKNGEKILEFRGKFLTAEQLPLHYSKTEDHYMQIGKNLYLGPSGSFDDFLNHSCNPNSGIKIKGKKIFLVATKNIKNGEEITWDYSTTMDESGREDFENWEMDCNCDSKNCRKRIKAFKFLPKNIQNRYIRLDVIPKYIINN